MGLEYRITCPPGKLPDFDAFLRRQPFFQSYDPALKLYHLRFADALRTCLEPDASVALEPDAIYFCDHFTAEGDAAKILRSLIDEALRFSDSISIHEP
jgi:hypothetical protein